MVQSKIFKEKASKPRFWLKIEPLQFNFNKQIIPTHFNIDITYNANVEWLLSKDSTDGNDALLKGKIMLA